MAIEARAIELVQQARPRRVRFMCTAAALFAGLSVGLLIEREHSSFAIAAAAVAAVAYRFTR